MLSYNFIPARLKDKTYLSFCLGSTLLRPGCILHIKKIHDGIQYVRVVLVRVTDVLFEDCRSARLCHKLDYRVAQLQKLVHSPEKEGSPVGGAQTRQKRLDRLTP